jgi:hypothetical protein
MPSRHRVCSRTSALSLSSLGCVDLVL